MHAHVFLENFWRNDLESQVFVAMDFGTLYQERFDEIFKPAIEGITYQDNQLRAFKVDMDQTGDIIHARIINGIAHSQLVLADISATHHYFGADGKPRRGHNPNVFYEVGMALAARQESELVLVREDYEELPFDLSSYPITSFDPKEQTQAIEAIQKVLKGRLATREEIKDLRVQKALRTLLPQEMTLIAALLQDSDYQAPFKGSKILERFKQVNNYNLGHMVLSSLLEKQIIKIDRPEIAIGDAEVSSWYAFTFFGRIIARHIKTNSDHYRIRVQPQALGQP